MKKLFTLLFTAALAFGLAAPVFAQDSSAPASSTTKTHKEKKTKTHKEKKTKSESAPPSK